VAADLLSQAEHGIDSQVVLVSVNLPTQKLENIEEEIDVQAHKLSRLDIIRQSISKSIIVKASSVAEAIRFSNDYAPEHLILHLENAAEKVPLIDNAGSVFVGHYSPERFVVLHGQCASLYLLLQLRGLRFRNESHTADEWICPPVQWS